MSDFDVKEKRFEEDIEDYLTHHGGYTKGDPKKFNRESGLEEDTFVEFIKTSQPKKWERYVKIYAENSEKQIIERFKREVKTTNLLNVMRHGFMDRGIKFYPIFWKPETSLNETTQMQYDANILHCTRQLHYSVHNEIRRNGRATQRTLTGQHLCCYLKRIFRIWQQTDMSRMTSFSENCLMILI